jgi:hypothetical protein
LKRWSQVSEYSEISSIAGTIDARREPAEVARELLVTLEKLPEPPHQNIMVLQVLAGQTEQAVDLSLRAYRERTSCFQRWVSAPPRTT